MKMVKISIVYPMALIVSLTGSCLGQTTYFVYDFGAKGDGVSNDQPAIQDALAHASADPSGNTQVIFDPGKTYLLQGLGTNSLPVHLLWRRSSPGSVALIGNNAILECNSLGTTMLQFWGYAQNSTVQDLTFTNFHGYTTSTADATTGIAFQSVSSGSDTSSHITNITITNCTLAGFAEGMAFAGAENISIISNNFLMPLGRDSGTGSNGDPPNVGIRLFLGPTEETDYNGNYTRNFTIAGNYYNGCSSSSPLLNTSHLCGDGFIWGYALQLHAYNNTISNFSFEGIFASLFADPPADLTVANEKSFIFGNLLDNTAFGPFALGIRAEVSYIEVRDNTINNCVEGLWATATGDNHATIDPTGILFHNNTVSVGTTTTLPASGMYIVGISSSQFYSNSFSLIGVRHGGDKSGGIAVGSASSHSSSSHDDYFYQNTLTALAQDNGFNGIQVDGFVLSYPVLQFTNNTFNNLQFGVKSIDYPLSGYSYPNDQTATQTAPSPVIAALIESSNFYSGCFPLPLGIVSWWKGEQNANDTMGANAGGGQGSLTYQSGEVNSAFQMDGTTAYVKIPSSTSLDVGAGGGFTIEGWFNVADTYAHPIVEWNSGTTFGVHLWANFANGPESGALFANVRDTGPVDHTFASSGGLFVPGVLNHVALTYDKTSGNAYIYLNGTQVASISSLGSITPLTSYDLYLGARVSDGTLWAGLLDEFSLYNRALFPNEIYQIYNAGHNGKCNP
jgi:hypothetical protein